VACGRRRRELGGCGQGQRGRRQVVELLGKRLRRAKEPFVVPVPELTRNKMKRKMG